MLQIATPTGRFQPRPWALCSWFAVPYALSTLALVAADIRVVVPWKFLLHVAGIALPYAYCLAGALTLAATTLGASRGLPPAVGLLLGAVVLWVGPKVGDWRLVVLALFCCLLLRDVRRVSERYFQSLTAALLSIVLGLGTVWNVNYLLVPSLAEFLNDPALMRTDVAIYEWLFGRPVEYREIFPLFESTAVFRVMENAYHTIFVETLVVILVLLWTKGNVVSFLRAAFLCYFSALVVFYFYPAVGPCIYYPETFRAAFEPTATFHLMQKLAHEFDAATRGAPVHGFAYFIAVPSLHAALALVCQWFLAGSRLHFWTFLPVNVGVVLSTILLGYHYIIDIPLGLLLALAAIWIVRQPTGRPAHGKMRGLATLAGGAREVSPGGALPTG